MATEPSTIQLKKVALVAGSGSLPGEFLRAAIAEGVEPYLVGLHSEADPALASLAKATDWVKVGQVGKLLSILRRFGVEHVAFVGGINKSRLFKTFRPDWLGARVMVRAVTGHDDAVLSSLAHELEIRGVTVIPPQRFLPKSVPEGVGTLGTRALSAAELSAARIGWRAATGIGALDIGQSVVVVREVVAAVEAVEGTDAMMRRAFSLSGKGGVLVKVCKPQQDLRLDLPTIGPRTIEVMKECGITAAVLPAGQCLVVEPQRVVESAVREGIALSFSTGDSLGATAAH